MKSLSFHLLGNSLGRPAGHSVGVLADSINDPSSTRKVYLLAAGLALLGLLLIAITVWFWRSTRHDPELLAPLEMMGQRRFRTLDGGPQQQLLDAARPPDAQPMRWGVVRGDADLEPLDLRAIDRSPPSGYEDLRDLAVAAEAAESDAVADAVADDTAVRATSTEDAAAGADVPPVGESTENAAVEEADDTELVMAAGEPEVLEQHDEQPLVIVPIDHDLPVLPADRLDGNHSLDGLAEYESDGARTADHTGDLTDDPTGEDDDVTTSEQRPSIDPLLRMFERNDR